MFVWTEKQIATKQVLNTFDLNVVSLACFYFMKNAGLKLRCTVTQWYLMIISISAYSFKNSPIFFPLFVFFLYFFLFLLLLQEKCPCLKFFWSMFCNICTEHKELLCKPSYSVREDTGKLCGKIRIRKSYDWQHFLLFTPCFFFYLVITNQ